MLEVWSTDQVRAAEERLMSTVDESVLMRRAAFSVAAHAVEMLRDYVGGVVGRRVVLLAGAGNNGGDALWAGAFLRRRGVAVSAVLLSAQRVHEQGLAAFRRSGGRIVSTVDANHYLSNADLVIDGIVGLSAQGSLRPNAGELVRHITSPILAVDLPSGVEPDSGAVTGDAIRATRTITFGAYKPVHVLNPIHCGETHLVDIGLGPKLDSPLLRQLENSDVRELWPIPQPTDDKYSQGVTGVVAGSSRYPGAAVLATGAAIVGTSGLVRYIGDAAAAVRAQWPEVITDTSLADAGKVQAWVLGPGLGTGRDAQDVVRQVLTSGKPVCIDADAITMLAHTPDLWNARDPDTPLILTPHDREFARLTGAEPGTNRVQAARDAARRFTATILLKGYCTVVAAPTGEIIINKPRGAWLATAGSGDVLSGLIGAALASGLPPHLAAAASAHLHSLAGTLSANNAPTHASALIQAIPQAIRQVRAVAP